jgi:hypothetical protein
MVFRFVSAGIQPECGVASAAPDAALGMGGSRSGRWGSGRPLAEAMRRIDLAQVRRCHPICARSTISISYTRADGTQVQATVALVGTPAHFGGQRLWLCCPSCRRRCQVLYGSWRIGCRRCHRLRYLSQSGTRSDRANLGMMKIVKRLDPDASCNELPSKPKGMHWSTYHRLADRYEAYDDMWAMAVMRQFGIRQVDASAGQSGRLSARSEDAQVNTYDGAARCLSPIALEQEVVTSAL